jgi:predicted Zn-dependent protease with MMP-like domain
MAAAALKALPARFRDLCADVVVKVEEFATREQLASVGLSDRGELSGLYEGRPLCERSVWDAGEMPAIVTLFRQPLLDEWRATGVRLDDLVTHVVVHELGHHFGFSDDTMHRLEDGEEFYPNRSPRSSAETASCPAHSAAACAGRRAGSVRLRR